MTDKMRQTALNSKSIQKITSKAVEMLKFKFKGDLVSVVLFGSYAKKAETKLSDMDILVVADCGSLSDEARWAMLKDIRMFFLNEYGIPLETIMMNEDEFKSNMASFSPLFVSFLTGFNILYDPRKVFKSSFIKMGDDIKDANIKYGERGKIWDISKLARNLKNML